MKRYSGPGGVPAPEAPSGSVRGLYARTREFACTVCEFGGGANPTDRDTAGDTAHATGAGIGTETVADTAALAAAVTAALTPADPSRYTLAVEAGAGMVAATVQPPAGADLLHLGEFLVELLDVRGLGSWRPFIDFGAGAIVLLHRVEEVTPDS